MTSFKVKQGTYDGATQNFIGDTLRANFRKELVTADFIPQLAADGRVFVGGSGPEVGGIDGAAALDDLTPTFALKAPANGTVALYLGSTMSVTVEGGAAPELDIVYDSTSRALSGTALTEKHNLLGNSARTPLSTAVHTGTAGAGTGATLAHYEITDNIITEATLWASGGMEKTVLTHKPVVPIPLVDGSQIYWYWYTGTTDTKVVPTIWWAELDEADYA